MLFPLPVGEHVPVEELVVVESILGAPLWLHPEPLADGDGPVALKLVLLPVGKHVHFEEHVVV